MFILWVGRVISLIYDKLTKREEMWPRRLAIASLSTLSFPSTHNSQVKDKENKRISFACYPNHPPKHYVNECRNKCRIAAHRESLNRNDHDTMSSSIIDEEKKDKS